MTKSAVKKAAKRVKNTREDTIRERIEWLKRKNHRLIVESGRSVECEIAYLEGLLDGLKE